MVNVIASGVTVAMLFVLGTRWYNARMGSTVALLALTSPFVWYYGENSVFSLNGVLLGNYSRLCSLLYWVGRSQDFIELGFTNNYPHVMDFSTRSSCLGIYSSYYCQPQWALFSILTRLYYVRLVDLYFSDYQRPKLSHKLNDSPTLLSPPIRNLVLLYDRALSKLGEEVGFQTMVTPSGATIRYLTWSPEQRLSISRNSVTLLSQ